MKSYFKVCKIPQEDPVELEKIKAFAYDLQEKLCRLKRRDPDRLADPDTVLTEQFFVWIV